MCTYNDRLKSRPRPNKRLFCANVLTNRPVRICDCVILHLIRDKKIDRFKLNLGCKCVYILNFCYNFFYLTVIKPTKAQFPQKPLKQTV